MPRTPYRAPYTRLTPWWRRASSTTPTSDWLITAVGPPPWATRILPDDIARTSCGAMYAHAQSGSVDHGCAEPVDIGRLPDRAAAADPARPVRRRRPPWGEAQQAL